MGRPRIKIKAVPANLTFPPQFLVEAKEFAFQNNESLSAICVRLLRDEMSRNQIPSGDEIAHALIATNGSDHANFSVHADYAERDKIKQKLDYAEEAYDSAVKAAANVQRAEKALISAKQTYVTPTQTPNR